MPEKPFGAPQFVSANNMMVITIDVGAPIAVGEVAGVTRRCVPLLGGVVEGNYSGIVVPGGSDWQTVAPNGMLEIQARYLLSLTQGIVEVRSEGVRAGTPEVLARLAAGESVPAHEYYFRTSIRFFTASRELEHLNELLAFSVGERMPERVRLAVYRIP